MYTGRNVDSTPAPAHLACDTVQFLEQAKPFTLDQIWGHQTAQTSIWFHKGYGVLFNSKFISCECIMLTNRSCAC